ncbi:MAG: glycosyltransferase [Clostridia bacterium]|nr:glycosyltransferase [Clostridia bacterium]
MNILLFSRILAKTGVGNYVKSLSEDLVNQGHTVTVVSSTKELVLDERVDFVCMPAASNNPFRIFGVVRRLHKLIKENDIEVVHCHHRKAALIMRLYNVFHRIPFVYTLHLANIPSDFLHRKMTFVGKRAIAISKEVEESLVNDLRISPAKITNIPNGVKPMVPLTHAQIELQKAEWSIPQGKYVLTLHSRIDAVKNHLLMVEAIARLSPQAKDKIVVVCSGEQSGAYYEQVAARIAELGLQDIFRFVGWCDTVRVLGISDFLFLPSLKEGFPLSVAEAFLLRVPVARTKTAGFEEQKYCLPLDVSDPQPIVDIIEDLVANGKEQYKERIEAAYTLAMEEFTIEVMTARNVSVYKEVCAK